MKFKFNKMKALFRLPLGKGRMIAVFIDMVVLEWYDKNGDMEIAKRLLG